MPFFSGENSEKGVEQPPRLDPHWGKVAQVSRGGLQVGGLRMPHVCLGLLSFPKLIRNSKKRLALLLPIYSNFLNRKSAQLGLCLKGSLNALLTVLVLPKPRSCNLL